MKNILTLLILTTQTIMVYSQSFWSHVADDESYNKSKVNDMALLADSIIVVGGQVSSVSCPNTRILAYNMSGHKLWEKEYDAHVLYSDSGSVYCIGYNIGADDIGGDGFLNVTKLNKHGELLLNSKYNENMLNYFVPNSMDLDEEKNILISSTKSILKADSSGKFKFEKKFRFNSDITNIQTISPEHYIINTSSILYKSDSAGILVDSIKFNDLGIKSFIYKDTIYQLFKTKIMVLDTSLDILDTIISATDIDLYDIKQFGDGLWLMGTRNDSIQVMSIKNKSISDVRGFKSFTNVPRFLISGDHVVFTGDLKSGQIATYHYKYGIEAKFNFPDIEITDYDFYNVRHNSDSLGYTFNTNLTVYNNGKDSITSFAVYANLYGQMNCLHNFFYQKVIGISILPQHTLTVKLNGIYQLLDNVCFEVLAPNSMIETDTTKNKLCKTITSIHNYNSDEKINIFPNPAEGILQVEFINNKPRDIKLTDIMGKIIITQSADETKAALKLDELNSGIYFLEITSDKGMSTKKFLKK
jgi:hypothetical protein